MRGLQAVIVVFGALAFAGIAAAATPVAGVYRMTIKGKPAPLNGTWLISFAPNGAYAVVKEPASHQLLIGGSSKVSHHVLSFDDMTGPLACKGSEARAKYSWTLAGSKLTLKPLQETCAGREAILATGSFTRVG